LSKVKTNTDEPTNATKVERGPHDGDQKDVAASDSATVRVVGSCASKPEGDESTTMDVTKTDLDKKEQRENMAPVIGSCIVRYNHYQNEHSITTTKGNPRSGCILVSTLDEMFYFSAVYKGQFTIILRGPGRCGDALPHLHDNKAAFTGLEIGAEYFCEVQEDEAAELEARGGKEKVVFKASTGTSLIKMGEGSCMGEDSASCSCIEGNPCAVPYNCKDWNNRFEIAKKNGWKGF
jgi:hypothetical protein